MTNLKWIASELHPRACSSAEFIYDDMDSQSGRSLPILYEPFDATRRSHWADRAALFDYLLSTQGEGKRLLDFGPGDGWPSLIVAPFAAEVVGVDGSQRRVSVCQENARRLGIANATFVYVPPGERLPFEDGSFDGAMAASSVEQTPDPRATLQELYRVLRPGGSLRIHYEALGGYRGGQEQDVWLYSIDGQRCCLILFDRHIEQERVTQYGLTFALPALALCEAFGATDPRGLRFSAITSQQLTRLHEAILDTRVCETRHPSGATWAKWLREAGFTQVLPTHNGSQVAADLFDALVPALRPLDLAGVDTYLRPIINVAIHLPAPLELDPILTAIRE